jgi:hypothetical protein
LEQPPSIAGGKLPPVWEIVSRGNLKNAGRAIEMVARPKAK